MHIKMYIYYFNEGPDEAAFDCKGIGILNIDLNNISLDVKFNEYDPDTNILTTLSAWHIKFVKRKELKKRVKWRIACSVASR